MKTKKQNPSQAIKPQTSRLAILLNLYAGRDDQINAINPLIVAGAPIVKPPTAGYNVRFAVFHLHSGAILGAYERARGGSMPLVVLATVLERTALERVSSVWGWHHGWVSSGSAFMRVMTHNCVPSNIYVYDSVPWMYR